MRTTLTLSLAIWLGACAGSPVGEDPSCVGEKCDTPTDAADVSCASRRADALSGGQHAYTPAHIRWACSDVAGVNAAHDDSRGQEYCEYFAVVQPPPPSPGAALPPAVALGRKTGAGATTPLVL